MRAGAKVFAVLTGLLITANGAAAQDFLRDRLAGINKKQSLVQPPKAFGNKGLVPPSFDKWNQNPNKEVCPSGSDCADSSYETDKIEPTGSTRIGNVNMYGSQIGFQAGMDSPYHVDATVGGNGMTGYLNGELTLAYITMGLTEPAVASGLAQAVNYVGHDVNNRLVGEQVFFNQLQYMPDVSQSLGQAYVNCISEKQKTYSWLTAQSMCSVDTSKDLTGSKAKFENIADDDQAFSFEFDPNHKYSTQDKKTILLSDYLFGIDSNMGSSQQGVKNFKNAWLKYIGDITYTIEKSTKDTRGTRNITYAKIKPTADFAALLKEEAGKGPSNDSVLETMLKSFHEACIDQGPSANPASADEGDIFLRQLTGAGGATSVPWATRLAYPGFAPDSTLMRMLWELGADPSTGSCPNGGNYDAFQWDQVVGNTTGAPELARDYMYIAQRIAFGRLYSLFILAEDYLRKVNAGPFDSFARKGAFELLYDAAGTTDMHAMFDQNTVALRQYFQLLASRTTNNKKFNKTKSMGGAKSEEQQGSNYTKK